VGLYTCAGSPSGEHVTEYNTYSDCGWEFMNKRFLTIVGCLLACVPGAFAMDASARPALKLEPAPKEVQLRDGGFRVGPHTKIYVQLGHQSEDRIAAETLAEEVEDESGLKLGIERMKAEAKAEDGAIVLARLQDDRVRRFLARNGLNADQWIGEDGYLLFSDNSHLIVAANSGQGLFYGVQTLRQLLRPEGKGLLCPAVGIRDWPSLQRVGEPSVTQTSPELARGGTPQGD
jgi:Glycosyl hydrolase family 20, domain 2